MVLPVKDNILILLSLAIASPISAPPHTVLHTAPGKLLSDRTLFITLVTAIHERDVLGAAFLV